MATPIHNSLSGSFGLPLDPNQREIMLRLETQRLRQDLIAARTLNQEYEALIISMFTALKSIQNSVCLNCKANVEKLVPSDFAAAPAPVPANVPRFSGLSQPGQPSPVPFVQPIFQGSQLQSSVPGSASLPAHHHQQSTHGTSSQTDQITSVTPTHISSSSSVPNVELAKKQTQTNWSITVNKEVKPSLRMSFEHAFTFDGSVSRVKFSSAGEYLAAGVNHEGGDWKAHIYDVKTGSKTFVLADLTAKTKPYLWSLCFSPNDQYLAISDSASRIWIWEIKKKLVRNIFKGHTAVVTFVDFSPGGRFLVSCSNDSAVRIWSIRDGFSMVLGDKASKYSQVRFSPNGRYITAANYDGELRIWNARTGQLVRKWSAHEKYRLVVFTRDGKGFFSSCENEMKYWDISLLEPQARSGGFEMQSDSDKDILKLTRQVDSVRCIDISSNGQWVVSGSRNRAIHIWDAQAFALQCSLEGHTEKITSVAFSPIGQYLATASADKRLALWRYVAA